MFQRSPCDAGVSVPRGFPHLADLAHPTKGKGKGLPNSIPSQIVSVQQPVLDLPDHSLDHSVDTEGDWPFDLGAAKSAL